VRERSDRQRERKQEREREFNLPMVGSRGLRELERLGRERERVFHQPREMRDRVREMDVS
jgi:hypothetical protein